MAKSSFLRHALVYGAGEALVSAANFLLLPLYVRALSPEEYGALDYLNRLGEIILLCLLFKGLRQALFSFQNQARDEAERRAVVGSALFLTLLFLGGGGAVVALFAEPLSERFALGPPGVLRLAILAVVLESVAALLRALAQARQKSLFFIVINAGQVLLKIVLCIVFVAVLRWGITGALIGLAASSGLFALYLLGCELMQGGLHIEGKQLKAMFWFALPFVPGGLGYFLINSGDRLFLKEYGVPFAAMGAYALGCKLAGAVTLFSKEPVFKVWSARMYEAARQPDAPRLFGVVFTRVLTLYAGVGLALCLVAAEVVNILGGNRYADAVGIIPPVVLAYFFLTATELMEAAFYIERKTAYKLPLTLAAMVVTVGLYIVLIPPYGIHGAAWATLVGFVFTTALTGVLSQRVFPVRYEWGRVGAMLGWAVVCWLVGWLLPHEMSLLPVKALLWFGWLGAVWLTVLSAEEKQWVGGLLTRSRREKSCILATSVESSSVAASPGLKSMAGSAGTGRPMTPSAV
jgi:O-antigen/teichoic acid export membrane protein